MKNLRRELNGSSGTVIVLCSLTLIVILLFTSITVDIGRGYVEKHRLRIATDAAALAAASILLSSSLHPEIADSEARAIALANGVSDQEITDGGGVLTGNWNAATLTFSPNVTPINAVQVSARVKMMTPFAAVIGMAFLTPNMRSIAAVDKQPNKVQCAVPFGIEEASLNGVHYGDTMIVGYNSPGNWGKLDMGESLSSNPAFQNAFQNGVCDVPLFIDDHLSSATGFAGLEDAWDHRHDTNPMVIFPVVDSFSNGNHEVQIKGFLVAMLGADYGNGSNWNGEFTVVSVPIGSSWGSNGVSPPLTTARRLVL